LLPTDRPIASSASAITMTVTQAIETRADIDNRMLCLKLVDPETLP
jgi:hypothetical protein